MLPNYFLFVFWLTFYASNLSFAHLDNLTLSVISNTFSFYPPWTKSYQLFGFWSKKRNPIVLMLLSVNKLHLHYMYNIQKYGTWIYDILQLSNPLSQNLLYRINAVHNTNI